MVIVMVKFRYIILIFLVLGAFLVVRYNNYKLDNPDDRVGFVKDYGKWLFGVGRSTANIAGAVIKEQWLPEKANETDMAAENETSAKNQPKVYVVYE
jgi:hypothetical protein